MIEGGKVQFSTKPESFLSSVVHLFNKGISAAKSVPQLEKMVMEKLFWSGSPLLEAVGENEPLVVEMRDKIKKALKQAMIPLDMYAKQYEKYIELAELDVNQYLE